MCKPQHQIMVSYTCGNQIFIAVSTREAADWLEKEFGWHNKDTVGVLNNNDLRSYCDEFINQEFILTVNSCFDVQEVRRKIERMGGYLPEPEV